MAKSTKVKVEKATNAEPDAAAPVEEALENGATNGATEKIKSKEHKRKRDDASEDGDDAVTETKVTIKKPKAKKEKKEVKKEVESDTEVKLEIVDGQVFVKGLLSYLARPLASEKTKKRLLRGVRTAALAHHIKRGVKEVNKGIKNCGDVDPATGLPNAIVIFAGDVSPFDVIAHMPVMCEDAHVPYIFVDRRSDLGLCAATKRSTSVVMVLRSVPPKAKDLAAKPREGGDEGPAKKHNKNDFDPNEWAVVYKEMVRVLSKAIKKA